MNADEREYAKRGVVCLHGDAGSVAHVADAASVGGL